MAQVEDSGQIPPREDGREEIFVMRNDTFGLDYPGILLDDESCKLGYISQLATDLRVQARALEEQAAVLDLLYKQETERRNSLAHISAFERMKRMLEEEDMAGRSPDTLVVHPKVFLELEKSIVPSSDGNRRWIINTPYGAIKVLADHTLRSDHMSLESRRVQADMGMGGWGGG